MQNLQDMSLNRRHAIAKAAGLALGLVVADAKSAAPIAAVDVTLKLKGHRVDVHFSAGFAPDLRDQALHWIRQSAQTVASYLGRFPLAHLDLYLRAIDGIDVRGGFTSVERAPFVRVNVGRSSGKIQFASDWILVHEMIHLAIPRLERRHNWLHEGIATYVEGVARTRAGHVAATQFWGELATGMPQGLPQEGDQGLDLTHTWGRTYWGGALFCLLADVRMRTATNNQLGLQQALQGVLAAGGSYAVQWPIERVLATADRAVGLNPLTDLHREMGPVAMSVDLPALWRELGVEPKSPDVARLSNDATKAAVRRAIAE